jgi:hypothetical protein
MFTLEIGCHATTHRAIFPTLEEAQAQLDLLQPKIGHRFYGKNAETEHSHTIKCPTGDVVVALEKVEVARIVDLVKFAEMATPFREIEMDKDTALEVRRHKALLRAKAEFLTEKTGDPA